MITPHEVLSFLSTTILQCGLAAPKGRTDAEVARSFTASLTRQVKEGRLNSKSKKYLLSQINPRSVKGVMARIRQLYSAVYQQYQSIYLQTKNDSDILNDVATELMDRGWCCVIGCDVELSLSPDEQLQLDQSGGLFVAQAMMNKADSGDFNGVFIAYYFAPNQKSLNELIDLLLLKGFVPTYDRIGLALNRVAELDLISVSAQRARSQF